MKLFLNFFGIKKSLTFEGKTFSFLLQTPKKKKSKDREGDGNQSDDDEEENEDENQDNVIYINVVLHSVPVIRILVNGTRRYPDNWESG